ncbi:hypothetical protein Emed_000236 [Eimeria media]
MSEASRGSTTFVIPPRNACAFQQKTLPAIPLTQECGFYSVATDAMEAEPHSSTSLIEYEENWLPTSGAPPLSRDQSEVYNNEFEDCVESTPRLFSSGCQDLSGGFIADSKEPPLQLASLVNALFVPGAALPANLEVNDLLATVEKHALAAGSLAHEYSCAAASLFDLRSLIKTLEQASPHEGRAAEMIIERVTRAKAIPETPCALSVENCECSKSTNDVVTLLRIFELERMLAPRLAAGTRRLLRLLRLATNLESASAHLCSFAAVLVGAPANEQEPQSHRNHPSGEKESQPKAQQKASSMICMRKMKGASQRLVLHGVAFHQGALLRATGFSQDPHFSQELLLGLPHPNQMLTEVNLFKANSNLEYLQNAETREAAAEINQWINPDHSIPQSPESFMQLSIDPLPNDNMTFGRGSMLNFYEESVNGSSDLRGTDLRSASLQLLMRPKATEPHAQDRESRASSASLEDYNGLPDQQTQENAAPADPPRCHSFQSHLAFTPASVDCCHRVSRCERSLKELSSTAQSERRSKTASRSSLSARLTRPHNLAAGVPTAACCSKEPLGRDAQHSPNDSAVLLPRERRHRLKRRPLSSDFKQRMHQGSVRLQTKGVFHHDQDSQGCCHVAHFESNTPSYESAAVESSACKEKPPAGSRERHAKHAWLGRPRCKSWLKSGSATICALSSTVTSTCRKLVSHSQGDDPLPSLDQSSRSDTAWTALEHCKATPPCSNPLKPEKIRNLLEAVGSRACGDLVHGWMQARRANENRAHDEVSRVTEES